jgi:hypothetical protein
MGNYRFAIHILRIMHCSKKIDDIMVEGIDDARKDRIMNI